MPTKQGYCHACDQKVPIQATADGGMDTLLVPVRAAFRALRLGARPRFATGYQCTRCQCLVDPPHRTRPARPARG